MDSMLDLPCMDEEGNVLNHQQRFWELMDVCINTFSMDLLSQIAEFRRVGKKIVTVDVVGYDKYTLKLVIKTK